MLSGSLVYGLIIANCDMEDGIFDPYLGTITVTATDGPAAEIEKRRDNGNERRASPPDDFSWIV